MEERILQFRIGAVVICAGAITFTLVLVFGEAWPWRSQYMVTLDTATAPNVAPNTPIRKNGILIGRVENVIPLDDGGVRLELAIDEGQKIFEGEVCQIGTASLLGDAVIEIVPGTKPRGELLGDGAFIPKENVSVKIDPMKAIDSFIQLAEPAGDAIEAVKRAGNSIDLVAQDIRVVTKRLQESIGDENSDIQKFIADAKKMAEKAETALDNFNNMMKNVNDVIGDQQVKTDIRQSIRDIPGILKEAKSTVEEARKAIKRLDDVGVRADTNLKNLEGFTKSLGEDGPAILESLRTSLGGVDELVEQITNFATALNESDGTISRLVHDPEMYQNLNQTLRNARDLSARMKPLVNDLRLITDTIARNPFKLGVPGVFDRGNGVRPKPYIPSRNIQYPNHSPSQGYFQGNSNTRNGWR